MTRLHRWWLPALLASALTVAACGDDDGGDDKAAVDSGIDGGSDGGRDASTSSDAGADAATAGLQCKTPAATKCGPFASPLGQPPEPCCYSGPLSNGTTADSVCSGRYMGTCLPPAVNDTRCDNMTLVGMAYTGCCALNGRCGINSNAAGLGCPDLETAEATVKAVLPSFSIPAASKRACAADAGTAAQTLVGRGLDAGF